MNVRSSPVTGVVVAVSNSGITVRHRGALTTFAITPTTTFSEGEQRLSPSDVTFGEHVGIEVSPSDPSSAENVNIELAVVVGTVTDVCANTITIIDREGRHGRVVVHRDTAISLSDAAVDRSTLVAGRKITARGRADATLTQLDATTVTIADATDKWRRTVGFG